MKINIITILLFSLGISWNATGQVHKKFIGTWEGVLNVGMELRIVFHISENSAGGLTATADSPDQAAFGIPCESARASGDSLLIEMNSLMADFKGRLIGDTLINGAFTQGQTIPLILKRPSSKTSERLRPQTPRPPFPYKNEEVVYNNSNKTLQFGATITVPEGKGTFPAVVLITGSGPQNRDEEIYGHKLFAVLADHLTRNGFIVLRADDRGTGKSTGKFGSSTTADFADDVETHINYLLSRPEVDAKKIGLIGHSEGGIIAPMVAARRKDIQFIILMAGPGIPIKELMAEQNAAVLRSSGISEQAINAYAPIYKQIIADVLNSPDSATAVNSILATVKMWADSTVHSTVVELGLSDVQQQKAMASTIAGAMSLPWFRYFLAFDPTPYLQQLNTKVLAINGDRDIQVIAGSNTTGIKNALKKSKSKKTDVVVLPGLNHLFQKCNKCSLDEYATLEETIAPIALKTITDWLLTNIK